MKITNIKEVKDKFLEKESQYSNDNIKSSKEKSTLKNLLNKLQEPFQIVERFDLSPHVHWTGSSTEPLHRWLRYREAYSPDLLDKLELGDDILDPFCGCGSMMVGAALRGKKSVGIDINPLSVFSTKVKLTKLNKRQLETVRTFSEKLPKIINRSEEWPLPKLSIAKKVFEPDILKVLLKTRTAIHKYEGDNNKIHNFLHLAWIESLEKVGSYFKEGNGIKYRNKKRCKGKYQSIPDGEWQLKRFGPDQIKFAIETIQKQIQNMLEDTSKWKTGTWSQQKVILGSAMNMGKLIKRRKFDSIIFSPPYANRFDYFEAFKVELWFGGFVNSYNELNAMRKKSLRSHLAAEYRKKNPLFKELEMLIDKMDKGASSWKMGVPDLLRGYFQDIQTVLFQCKKLSPKGKTYVVVGNSAFAGVLIPTDVLTAMIGLRSGFDKVKILESRHLTVAPQQRSILSGYESFMRESVVIFE